MHYTCTTNREIVVEGTKKRKTDEDTIPTTTWSPALPPTIVNTSERSSDKLVSTAARRKVNIELVSAMVN